MRMKEINIHSYGPLANLSIKDLGDFTLIFGENESGKTLLLDAIIRMMIHDKRQTALI